MKSLFVKAMTVKEFLPLTPRPKNLYIEARCSMENCGMGVRVKDGFLEVRNIGRAGGEPSGIWWVGTVGGPGICVHEDEFLYKNEI